MKSKKQLANAACEAGEAIMPFADAVWNANDGTIKDAFLALRQVSVRHLDDGIVSAHYILVGGTPDEDYRQLGAAIYEAAKALTQFHYDGADWYRWELVEDIAEQTGNIVADLLTLRNIVANVEAEVEEVA
ncbi:hypothetical protein [Aliiruegeria lutimaris]|uniref:Uncharacterized protein n=1 Tax=Aliiruegeria lutimaris TaxID=571298 RepID=A0A1G9ESJ0_9RHOB|nr:hypothetical protein [Aliiruegeria lutimaris]SDK79099.1 hypothetical protein SAMN04488026_105414 [Aliiruegeria lutimaris]